MRSSAQRAVKIEKDKQPTMRIKHVLWQVGNGWIRTPDDSAWLNSSRENIFVFDNLRQFADWAKKQEQIEKSERRCSRGAADLPTAVGKRVNRIDNLSRSASPVQNTRNDSTDSRQKKNQKVGEQSTLGDRP